MRLNFSGIKWKIKTKDTKRGGIKKIHHFIRKMLLYGGSRHKDISESLPNNPVSFVILEDTSSTLPRGIYDPIDDFLDRSEESLRQPRRSPKKQADPWAPVSMEPISAVYARVIAHYSWPPPPPPPPPPPAPPHRPSHTPQAAHLLHYLRHCPLPLHH